MSKIETGGPAFPNDQTTYTEGRGMTLRDYFAAKAMPGIVQCTGYATKRACMDAAESAYGVADAMLEARK